MVRGAEDRARGSGPDRLIAGSLFAATVATLAAWPALLNPADEAHFFYHSLKVMEGAVPYRDFFDFFTPLSYYAMGLVLRVFGAEIGTAKIAMALVHATTVALLYLGGRRLGARPALAAAGAGAFLAIGPPAWPYASPHWIACLLLVAMLVLLIERHPSRRTLVTLGLLLGALVATQHQTGAPLALGIVAVLVARSSIERRMGDADASMPLLRQLLCVTLAAVAVAGGVLVAVAVAAGPDPVIDQLVLHPFRGYRRVSQASWGSVLPMARPLADLTFPWLLACLPPGVIGLSALRLWAAWRRRDAQTASRQASLLLYALATVAALLYHPDFIHLAFSVPVFLALAVDAGEWALRRAPLASAPRWLPTAGALLLIVATGVHLRGVQLTLQERYGVVRTTAFGDVAFATEAEADLVDRVRAQLARSRTGELFTYPFFVSLYLTTGGRNPTRHVILWPGYVDPGEFDEVIEILEERRVPAVFLLDAMIDQARDPIYTYVSEHYRCAHVWAGKCLWLRVD